MEPEQSARSADITITPALRFISALAIRRHAQSRLLDGSAHAKRRAQGYGVDEDRRQVHSE